MTQVADTRKSTNLIKKYLTSKYGVSFKVKTDKYSMGSSLNIDWTCGPDSKVIDAEISRLQAGTFNGMEDLYEYKNTAERGMILDGFQIETQKYVFSNQNIPFDIFFQIAKIMSTKWKWGQRNGGNLPIVAEPEDMTKSFDERYGSAWNWRDMVYQNWQTRNFVTDVVESIIIKDVVMDENSNGRIIIIYEFNGVEYTTKDLKVSEPEVKKEKVINVNNIRLVEYSDLAIAVIGNTYEIKDELKAIGGKFNKFLTIDGNKQAGWIFSKAKWADVSDCLIDYSKI